VPGGAASAGNESGGSIAARVHAEHDSVAARVVAEHVAEGDHVFDDPQLELGALEGRHTPRQSKRMRAG
jgi:hypothetical protein